MADNFVKCSFSVEMDEKTYDDFATMMDALDSISDTELPRWYREHEGLESKHDLECEFYPSDADFSYENGTLHVWNDKAGGMDAAVEALRAAMGNNNITEPVMVEYAVWCEEPDSRLFRGGVMVVGPWMVMEECTYDIGQRLCSEMREKMKPANDSAPSMS